MPIFASTLTPIAFEEFGFEMEQHARNLQKLLKASTMALKCPLEMW